MIITTEDKLRGMAVQLQRFAETVRVIDRNELMPVCKHKALDRAIWNMKEASEAIREAVRNVKVEDAHAEEVHPAEEQDLPEPGRGSDPAVSDEA